MIRYHPSDEYGEVVFKFAKSERLWCARFEKLSGVWGVGGNQGEAVNDLLIAVRLWERCDEPQAT